MGSPPSAQPPPAPTLPGRETTRGSPRTAVPKQQASWHGQKVALCTATQRCSALAEPQLNVSTDKTLQK